MIVVAAEQFLRHLVINYGKQVKYLQMAGGTWYSTPHKPANY